ncbi:MAG: energy transducer TonB [Prevotellaceae bacterium]|nr:energy transducer TonB [Prevotellaceae bacterium]
MFFVNILRALGELVNRYQVAIYVTVIFHLCAAVVLMSLKVHTAPHLPPMEVVLGDFSEEEAEKLEALQREKAQLEHEVARLLRQTHEQLRNAAVNEEWEEKDGGQRDELLHENDALQERLAATRELLSRQEAQHGEAMLQNARSAAGKEAKKDAPYAGPSVMSYRLEGRRAFALPVPVYLCESGGDVVVNITVARDGTVTAAKVDEKKSAAHPCIRDAARQAALLSRFSVAETAKSQQGSITYRFIPQ